MFRQLIIEELGDPCQRTMLLLSSANMDFEWGLIFSDLVCCIGFAAIGISLS